MAYENEKLFKGDDLNMVPNKKQWSNITKRITTTDTEALIELPHRNVNASGFKKGTKNGLGEKSLFS